MNVIDIPELFICDLSSPWAGTPLNDFYSLNPKKKGIQGEKIAGAILEKIGYNVQYNAPNNGGFDMTVDGKKTEIKFSLASERNFDWRFTFNHIGFKKDWEQIIFIGINGDMNIHIVKYNKNNLPKDLLSHQQGGKTGGNDDYMCSGLKSKMLMIGGECLLNGMKDK